ncbi:MAG: hypothetical protein KGN78_13195, partial [Actinomycetales bacterium]|nr:hypothetical protein [Actinomycetales bacterium]
MVSSRRQGTGVGTGATGRRWQTGLGLIAVVAALLAGQSSTAGSAAEPVQLDSNGHYYAYVPGVRTWEQAKAVAGQSTYQGLIGHLATVTSAAEQSLLESFAQSGGWIGAAGTVNGGSIDWRWDEPTAVQPPLANCQAGVDAGGCSEWAGFHRWFPSEPRQPSSIAYAAYLGAVDAANVTVRGAAEEYHDLRLSAPYGTQVTSVRFASYGTPSDFQRGWCHSGVSEARVSDAFLNRSSGIVSASNGVFGDPCVGTYKRLHVVLGVGGGYWQSLAQSEAAEGFFIEYEPAPRVVWAFDAPGEHALSAPGTGWYRLQALGAGGGGGRRDWGWNAGAGGGGGAYAGLEVFLLRGQSVTVKVGAGGSGAPGACCGSFTDGGPGGDSSIAIDGQTLLLAGGGGGGGGSGTTDFNDPPEARGGYAGQPQFIATTLRTRAAVSHSGGRGGDSDSVSGSYHNGGDGGGAANTDSDGADGSNGSWARCTADAMAAAGDMPSGLGAWGGVGPIIELHGYGIRRSACPRYNTLVAQDHRALMRYGAGAGGTKGNPHAVGAGGYVRVSWINSAPVAPTAVVAQEGDGALRVSWQYPADAAISAATFTATAQPGGAQCHTGGALSCVITGLTNRVDYTVTVIAGNEYGDSAPSDASTETMPLAPGLQVWTSATTLLVGENVDVQVAHARVNQPVSVRVSGQPERKVVADARGRALTGLVATRGGVLSVVVRSGKTTTSTKVYTPTLALPTSRVKWGKSARLSVLTAPPGTSVTFVLSDGKEVTA